MAGLGQVGGLAVVVELEQCGAALNLGLHKCRGTDFLAADFSVGGVEGEFDSVTNIHDRAGLVVTKGEVAHVQQAVGLTFRGSVGESIVSAGSLGDDSEVIGAQFSIQRSVGIGWNLPQLSGDFDGRLPDQGQGVVRLGQLAGEQTLHKVEAATEGDEDEASLFGDTLDTSLDTYTYHPFLRLFGALSELPNNLRVGVGELDKDRLGQGGIVSDLNVLSCL